MIRGFAMALNDMVKRTKATPSPIAKKSALDTALLKKTEAEQITFLRLAVSRGLDKDDPVFDIYNTASASARSACSIAEAALQVVDGIHSIPLVIQDAIIAGSDDIKEEVQKAFADNVSDLKKTISTGLQTGTLATVRAINNATQTLHDAAAGIDKSLQSAIEKKQEAVIDDWVNTGSELLEEKIQEALLRQRVVTVSFIFLMMGLSFIAGFILRQFLYF
jgi:hypothetical protein